MHVNGQAPDPSLTCAAGPTACLWAQTRPAVVEADLASDFKCMKSTYQFKGSKLLSNAVIKTHHFNDSLWTSHIHIWQPWRWDAQISLQKRTLRSATGRAPWADRLRATSAPGPSAAGAPAKARVWQECSGQPADYPGPLPHASWAPGLRTSQICRTVPVLLPSPALTIFYHLTIFSHPLPTA